MEGNLNYNDNPNHWRTYIRLPVHIRFSDGDSPTVKCHPLRHTHNIIRAHQMRRDRLMRGSPRPR